MIQTGIPAKMIYLSVLGLLPPGLLPPGLLPNNVLQNNVLKISRKLPGFEIK